MDILVEFIDLDSKLSFFLVSLYNLFPLNIVRICLKEFIKKSEQSSEKMKKLQGKLEHYKGMKFWMRLDFV